MEESNSLSLKKVLVIPELDKPHVHMRDPGDVSGKLKKMVEGGSALLQVITDFDRTLTKDNVNGVPTKSSYGVFELCAELPVSFRDGCRRLCEKYHPIEVSPNLTVEEKIPFMVDWWKQCEDLYCGLQIDKNMIDRAVKEANVEFRDGCHEMLKKLNEKSIPVLVLSAGLGDVISLTLQNKSLNYPNVHVISNFFRFDGNEIIGYLGPTIHVFNKNEKTVQNSEYFNEVNHRSNVLLLGDSLGDANMAEGVPEHYTVLKIGFLTSKHITEFLPQYMEKFDVVLVDDQTMDIPMAILNSIL